MPFRRRSGVSSCAQLRYTQCLRLAPCLWLRCLPVLISVACFPAAAQQSSNVDVGTRLQGVLRYHPRGESFRTLVGEVAAIEPDTLRLRVLEPPVRGDRTIPIAMDNVEQVAVSKGYRWNVIKGTLMGAGGGVLLGGVVAIASVSSADDCILTGEEPGCRRELVKRGLRGALIGGTIGGLLGAFIGSFVRVEEFDVLELNVLTGQAVIEMSLSF